MSKTDEAINAKKVEEFAEEEFRDSGFLSGFQDSREISSIETVANNAMENPADKNEFDSAVVPIDPLTIQITSYDFYKDAIKRSVIGKYFEQDEGDGFNGLHLAILHSNWSAINTLIALASDASYLNIKSFCGQTALHLACILNQPTTVEKLIHRGANIYARDSRCQTALMIACANESFKCVQTILLAVQLLKGPEKIKLMESLEYWNFSGETCFYIACKLRNVPIARALESVGANVNVREGKSGKTALMTAIESRATEVISFLCEECTSLSIDIENYCGLTAYQICLLTEQENLADYLVSRAGATPFFTDDSDMDDDSSSDSSFLCELEKNMLINKISEIAVN